MICGKRIVNGSVSGVVERGLCNGCGTCQSSCPEDAIRLSLNSRIGLFVPIIDKSICTNCGSCRDACPGLGIDLRLFNLELFGNALSDPLLGSYRRILNGHSNDERIRFGSASGGMITQLLVYAFEKGVINGALVTRMSRNNPLVPEPIVARTVTEIVEASKSKYCPVPANVALREILESSSDDRFAVVGLPCHIHGLRKAEMVHERLRRRIRLHFGLFCGTGLNFLATEFLLKRMAITTQDVVEIQYRGEGWPGKLTIRDMDGRRITVPYMDYFNFRLGPFINWRCRVCPDRTNFLSDISFGDAWNRMTESRNSPGESIVISRTPIGDDLLRESAKAGLIDVFQTRREEIVKSQALYDKQLEVSSRIGLARRLGHNLPEYGIDLGKPRVLAYPRMMIEQLLSFVACNHLWGILDTYFDLLEGLARMKSRSGSG